jgi:hypothetical protein
LGLAEIVHVTERHIVEGLGFLALSGVVFDILRGASFLLTLSFPIVGDALAGQCRVHLRGAHYECC